MEVLLDEKQLHDSISRLAGAIKDEIGTTTDVAVIGIRSRGEILAQRLVKEMNKHFANVLSGTLDITLYRDDLNATRDVPPTVRATEISFDVGDKVILLVDDVLHTGRSVRAAMDALTDFGRPKMVRLAVLVDRGCHEYPICADFTGLKVKVDPAKFVRVHFYETDNEDRVIIE